MALQRMPVPAKWVASHWVKFDIAAFAPEYAGIFVRGVYAFILDIFMMLASIVLMGINTLYTYSCITRYNDEDYLTEVLLTPGNHLNSFELIRADLMDSMIFGIFLVLGLIPVFVIAVKKLRRCVIAERCAA